MAGDENDETRQKVDISDKGLAKTRRAGLGITLGTFLTGYVTGVIAGALIFLADDFGLSEGQQGLVTSIVLLSAMVSAFFTGRLADRFGRKAMLGVAGVLFVIGLVIAALAPGFWLLILGRLVMGFGVGVASSLVPTYLGEISPPQIRGRMLTLNQLLQTVGMLTAYVVNLVFSSSANWRGMFWAGAVPAVLLVLIAARLPDSPVWLVRTGRADAAHDMLEQVAGADGADVVVERYRRENEEQRELEERSQQKKQTGWRALLTPSVRPALIVGVGLAILQQLVGINTVLYYAPTIMQQTGLDASNSIIYSVIIGVVNLAMTILSLWLIDRVGRRPLLVISLTGMGISVALLGLAFILGLSSLVMLAGMLIFVMSFAVGMGPVFWVLLGEIFPSENQAEGSGVSTAVSWLSNFGVSMAFLPLASAIGTGPVFLIFAVACVIGLWFVGRYVPETKDRSFDQIDAELQARAHGEKPEDAAA